MPVTASAPLSGRCRIGHRTLRWLLSTRADGDLRPDIPVAHEAVQRRRRLIDLPWTLLDQQHGSELVEVSYPGQGHLAAGDIVATEQHQAVIGMWAGDCVPVLLASAQGTLVMAHVGWRGLVRGVVATAVDRIGNAGPETVRAWMGPHIGPCCYEFDAADIEVVAHAIGVEATRISTPYRSAGLAGDTSSSLAYALDMGAAVRAELARCGVVDIGGVPCDLVPCTGCDDRWFSWRRRAETERHVMAAWWE